MERMRVNTFIAKGERLIEMYDTKISFIEKIIAFSKKYDGKKIDKRFLDKVNELAPKDVLLDFNKDYKGNRENRLRIVYANRYIEKANAYLENWEYVDIIYADKCGAYIDYNDFKLNYENFKSALQKELQILINYREEQRYAIEHTDDIIDTYEMLAKVVKDKMETIPTCLRENIYINCPLYR